MSSTGDTRSSANVVLPNARALADFLCGSHFGNAQKEQTVLILVLFFPSRNVQTWKPASSLSAFIFPRSRTGVSRTLVSFFSFLFLTSEIARVCVCVSTCIDYTHFSIWTAYFNTRERHYQENGRGPIAILKRKKRFHIAIEKHCNCYIYRHA